MTLLLNSSLFKFLLALKKTPRSNPFALKISSSFQSGLNPFPPISCPSIPLLSISYFILITFCLSNYSFPPLTTCLPSFHYLIPSLLVPLKQSNFVQKSKKKLVCYSKFDYLCRNFAACRLSQMSRTKLA